MSTIPPSTLSLNESIRLRKRAAIISVGVGILLFFLKGGAYLLTGSAAILSDAMESVVHILATVFVMYSVSISSRPADVSHPYGHGRIEFMSAGFEGGLVVLAALSIIYVAGVKLWYPPELPYLNVGVIVSAIVGIVNLLLGWHLIRVGRQHQSLALVADGYHVLTDSYTSLGVVGGLLLVLATGWKVLDPLVAILIGMNITFTGYKLMRESIRGLMDEADPQLIEQVTRVLDRHREPAWIDIHRLRCWRAGEIRHLDFHLTLPFYLRVVESHQMENRIEKMLREAVVSPLHLLIHHDPCMPTCCPFCAMPQCAERKHPLTIQKKFEAGEVIKNAQYLIVGEVQ